MNIFRDTMNLIGTAEFLVVCTLATIITMATTLFVINREMKKFETFEENEIS